MSDLDLDAIEAAAGPNTIVAALVAEVRQLRRSRDFAVHTAEVSHARLEAADAEVRELRAGRDDIVSELDFAHGSTDNMLERAEAAEASELEWSRRAAKAEAAIEAAEFGSIRRLIHGTSLPLAMEPARERWLTQLDALAALSVRGEDQ